MRSLVGDASLVVLAGGRGRRLGGVVKPLIRRSGDETLVETIARRLGPLADHRYLVAPSELHPMLRPVWSSPMLADGGEGPARALAVAAKGVPTGWALVVAADLVEPDPTLMAQLAARRRPEVDAIVPVAAGYDQPLFAVYRTSALVGEFEFRSMKAWLAALATERVPSPSLSTSASLADVDTPEDLARWGLRPPKGEGPDDG